MDRSIDDIHLKELQKNDNSDHRAVKSYHESSKMPFIAVYINKVSTPARQCSWLPSL